MRHARWSGTTGVIVVLGLILSLAEGAGDAAPDKRELQAREAFAAGRYQEALDVFVKLYAEKVHPIYLRNIGRCYQNLGEPDKAISSFREYLRQSRSLRPDERGEVEGYIKEMEELKQQRLAAATPPPTTTTTGAGPSGGPSGARPADSTGGKVAITGAASDRDRGSSSATLPAASEPGAGSGTSAPVLVQTPRSGSGSAPEDESPPVYTRWWFWTLIGGVIVGGVAVAAATGAFSRAQDASCTAPGGCK